MRHFIVTNGPRFKLESWGGGVFYTLTNLATGYSIHLQGDDAARFEEERERVEENFQRKTDDEVCAWLWDQCEYGLAAVPPYTMQDKLRDEIANTGDC